MFVLSSSLNPDPIFSLGTPDFLSTCPWNRLSQNFIVKSILSLIFLWTRSKRLSCKKEESRNGVSSHDSVLSTSVTLVRLLNHLPVSFFLSGAIKESGYFSLSLSIFPLILLCTTLIHSLGLFYQTLQPCCTFTPSLVFHSCKIIFSFSRKLDCIPFWSSMFFLTLVTRLRAYIYMLISQEYRGYSKI